MAKQHLNRLSAIKTTPTHIIHPKSPKRPKSSKAARDLIAAAIKKHGSQSKAAYALRLPSQGHLRKILIGQIKDSLEMKAALSRAKTRAHRAFFNLPDCTPPNAPVLDIHQVKVIRKELDDVRALLTAMLPEEER